MSSESDDDFLEELQDAIRQAIEDGPVTVPGMGCVFLVRPPKTTEFGNKGVLMIPEKLLSKCDRCDGDGVLWDETACGDPEHCSPSYECPCCTGIGYVNE